ncbi:8915_t:CDS:2 [Entrophospora sp. SA101]|nr:1196_t:CDS:2 [Entrophospora candida]CAJ0856813.1 15821_t:CDS:2 [Entrophospora sp. SA101]CAJ0882675.1 8915_t:CDS:2 [Entrophospora sp. SA101]
MSLFEVPDWNLGELITQKPETNKNNSKRKHRKNKISKDKKKKSYDEKVKNVDKKEEVGNSSSNMNNTKKKGKSSPSSKKNVSLQQKARMNLLESKFRWLNEQLYNKTSTSAFELFKNNSKLFDEYLKQKPKNLIVADLGCGEAKIAKEAPNKILSFDFVAKNDKIIVFIFSLSLMGTNYIEFLKEAHRVLKPK